MSQPTPPPISAALWARLRRLDPQCRITISRQEPTLAYWRGSLCVWWIMIQDRRAMAHESVRVEHPLFAEALRQAVEDAERRGWPLPV